MATRLTVDPRNQTEADRVTTARAGKAASDAVVNNPSVANLWIIVQGLQAENAALKERVKALETGR